MVKKESLEIWQLFSESLQGVEEEKSRFQRQVQFITEHTADIINEKIQMAEELGRRTQELDTMASLAQALIQLRELPNIMDLAVQRIPRILGVEGAGIYLWDEKAENLTLSHSCGLDAVLCQEVAIRKLGQGLVGMVAKSRQPFSAADVTALPPMDSIPTLVTGVRGFAAVPIAISQNLLGVLVVGSPHPWECTPHHVEVLTTLGNLIAAAIESGRLYQEAQQQVKRMQTISRLSSAITSGLGLGEVYETFARSLKEVIEVDWAVVTLIEESEKKLRFIALSSQVGTAWQVGETIPLEGTATAWAANNRQPSYESDLANERLFWTDEPLLKQGLRTVFRLPLVFNDRVFGSLVLGSCQPNAYSRADRDMLEELASQIAVAISNHLIFEQVSRREAELEATFSESLRVWIQSWENRYPLTKGHSDKVAHCARRVAQQMGLPGQERQAIESAARLHDIGMVTIPDEVMLRLGNLTPSERVMLEQHPQVGADMLRFSPILQGVVPLILTHHERYDGGGFPKGLKGEEIPLGGRILAVAEGYTLMGMELPYRPAFTLEKALDYLKGNSGSRYDPQVVQAFLPVINT